MFLEQLGKKQLSFIMLERSSHLLGVSIQSLNIPSDNKSAGHFSISDSKHITTCGCFNVRMEREMSLKE
jgi:hypothetical protein